MTCREFKAGAAVLTLWELSRGRDEGVQNHARQCESCGRWLQEQRTLAASLQTLQARTAGQEAGAEVERALLRAFRQSTARSAVLAESVSTAVSAMAADTAPDRAEEPIPALQVAAMPRSNSLFHALRLRPGQAPAARMGATSPAPLALRLSRLFEIGAYVAIAAAIMVGLFLGIRLLQHSSRMAPVQSQVTPDSTKQLLQRPVTAAQTPPAETNSGRLTSASSDKRAIGVGRSHLQPAHLASEAAVATETAATAEDTQTYAEAGYEPLMFCDPLSCATGSQVVRMELPASATAGGQNSQPQVADVVVGYDGVVRAVRLLN
jgi:hypothetical protein